MTVLFCPCCSKKPFQQCCEPFVTGESIPKTPEQLMRSRYTAYCQANVDYIESTMTGAALESFNKAEAQLWSLRAKFYCLDVLNTSVKGNIGKVEFIALYKEQGHDRVLHERSQFERINSRWFYTDGDIQ